MMDLHEATSAGEDRQEAPDVVHQLPSRRQSSDVSVKSQENYRPPRFVRDRHQSPRSRPSSAGHDISHLSESRLSATAAPDDGGRKDTDKSWVEDSMTQEEVELPQVHIAVLGPPLAGKSTFIEHALDLKESPVSSSSCKKVSLEGSIYLVHLVELDSSNCASDTGDLLWPDGRKSVPFAYFDGVLLLFDMTNQESFESLSDILPALSNVAIPLILVACKCDANPRTWRISAKMIATLVKRYKDIESFQTALNASETHKRCISVMIRNIILRKAATGDQCTLKHFQRPRATTSFQHDLTSRTSKKHGRAASEVVSCGRYESPSNITRSSDPTPRAQVPVSTHSKKSIITLLSIQDEGLSPPFRDEGQACLDDHVHPREPYSSQISFRKIGSCVAESPGLVAGGGATEAEHQTSPLGVSFQSLVGRLLARPASKNDSKFNISFLCLYRKFTAPLCLLTEIVQRFESATEGDDPGLLVLSSQMRYLDILQLWASYHPGDFAHEDVHAFLASFLSRLAMDAQFALAYKELTPFLHVVDDEDDYERIALGYSRSRASTLESFHSTSSTQSAVSTLTADSSTSDGGELTSPRKSSLSQTVHDSAPSVLDSASERSSSRSTGSSQVWLRTVEDARQQAHFLKPRPCYDLDKIRWHQLVDLPDDQIALELTRIDWIFYSSLRLRDLVRHSSLHPEAKERCKSLQYFSSMIQHFNHVALWTANMVLIRDKPKHRAVMLEKFMGISWRLRYMNNYNALGAILAGINGTAVHRLAQTRNLVSPEAKRQFMRLEILMGTARSHSAYRLAWQNTSGPRIPFLPLHQRDLVSAEAGNKTFLGNDAETCINWRKFEVMGDILMEIQESQAVPYPSIKRNEEILRLILGGKLVTDEDALFERSLQLEGPGVGENIRKKLNIFQR